MTSAATPTSCTTWSRASHAYDAACALGRSRRAIPCRRIGLHQRRRRGLALRRLYERGCNDASLYSLHDLEADPVIRGWLIEHLRLLLAPEL
jgi:hypothetical protein